MSTPLTGKVMTVLGPVAPEQLGAVLMHEHCYGDGNVTVEGPTPPERVELLRAYCAPFLKRLGDYGCHAICDCSTIPGRAEPWVYKELAQTSGCHIVLATGFYREAAPDEHRPMGAGIPHRWLDQRVVTDSVDAVADIMIGEFDEGIRGSNVRPGVIKLASTRPELTPLEQKAFRAGVKAQRRTGLAITTHATGFSAQAQFSLLLEAGANPTRVILGHTNSVIAETPWVARSLAANGATLLPTNLRMDGDPVGNQRLVDGIRRLFDQGHGDRLVLGLDWAFENEQGPFIPCTFMPPPPYIYMFTHTLPRMREMGLEEAAIEQMLVRNPAPLLALVSPQD